MTTKDLKILVADDSPMTRRLIILHLEKIGYSQIVESENGLRALDIIRQGSIDLVISDWKMPEMDGLELLKEVRADENFHDLPFVMLTAETQMENIKKVVEQRVNQYIVKPVTAEKLEKGLNKILKQPDQDN